MHGSNMYSLFKIFDRATSAMLPFKLARRSFAVSAFSFFKTLNPHEKHAKLRLRHVTQQNAPFPKMR